jgi:predicted SAM-dependent methyltransferase
MKLDLGCGKRKQEGFIGVDVVAFDGVDVVCDLSARSWVVRKENDLINKNVSLFATNDGEEVGDAYLFLDNSVDQVFSSHFVEHLTGDERIHFFNELWRVLKPGAQAQIITPDWSHACAYGDPTHQWPPMSGWYPLYLNKAWREENGPHVPYTCDFDWTTGGSWDEWLNVRNGETKMFAMQRYINSQRDLYVTLTKRAKSDA